MTDVLDVGGSANPASQATHILDLLPPSRPTLATFVQHDICRKPWPFPDRRFDYAFCTHTLEDVRDPIAVCQELMRVSRAGYIETPSRIREIFTHKRGYRLRRAIGRPARVGFGHHRWFCEREGDGLVFIAKTITAVDSSNFVLTRSEVGRGLTPDEAVLAFQWSGSFPVREKVMIEPGEIEADLRAFKRAALKRLTT